MISVNRGVSPLGVSIAIISTFLLTYLLLLSPDPQVTRNKLMDQEQKKELLKEKLQNKEKLIQVRLEKLPTLKVVKPAVNKPKKAVRKSNEDKELATTQFSVRASQKEGAALIKSGKFPQLEGELQLHYAAYLNWVRSVGGKLIVYNKHHKRIEGSIRKYVFTPQSEFTGYSARARDIHKDIPSQELINYRRIVEDRIGYGVYRYMVLFPTMFEERLMGAISLLLKQKGLNFQQLDRVFYIYMMIDNNLLIKVVSVYKDGKKLMINQLVRI